KVFALADLSISRYKLNFFTTTVWDPVKNHYGALLFLYGTAVSSFVALLVATPLSIAIGLYLSELAPRGIRGLIASLVEMLAAIPSVVLGLWGILVLGPFMAAHVDPWLHDTLGEAIAVTQVIGGATRFNASWFAPADTLASKIAGNYQSASTRVEASSLIYLAAILLVIGLVVNVIAQVIIRRFDPVRSAGRA